MKPRFSTKRCTALIAGATAGLGAEFARQLAPVAKRLILVGRREERLGVLVESFCKEHPSLTVEAFRADLSLASERERLTHWIVREEIPLNLLINNAGLGDLGPFDNAGWERLSPAPADAEGPVCFRYPQCQFRRRIFPPSRDGCLCRDQGVCDQL